MAEPESLREFEFLPNLPKSNLDDRTFEDLVQECILRIPRYCPEWTNYNPGDPGITLIELFSWLVKQMLFRFNQVPRRHYVAFLELLGIRLQPSTSAHVDVTFHLIKEQNAPLTIPANTEVATVRTETEPAVVFITDTDLIIGQPRIQGLFTAPTTDKDPHQPPTTLNPISRSPLPLDWSNLDEAILFETCTVGNCFYLVVSPTATSPNDRISGNILAINFKGIVAGTTGINPDYPPVRWEAWDGEQWRSGILRQRQDDRTKGFSFHELRQQGLNPEQEGADVVLHLPQTWQETDFGQGEAYRGYWIRCIYRQTEEYQGNYSYSPIITSITVRSIGGTISASECVRIAGAQTEVTTNGRTAPESIGILLGVSDGKPGQVFQLQGFPVLIRKPEEHIRVCLPDGTIEAWQEVQDFGDSDDQSPHYILDSLTGTIQFGPLIREPTQLQRQTAERGEIQPWGKQLRQVAKRIEALNPPLLSSDVGINRYEEWQYGKVPPTGSEIYITAYRVGGGSRGNVQAGKLTVLKTAIPYVKQVVNYKAAEGGKEGESLDEVVLRAPQILRSSQVAVTPEDFENIAKRSSRSVYRAHCPPEPDTPGVVRILIVPTPSFETNENGGRRASGQIFSQGFPDRFELTVLGREQERLKSELARRKPLGVQVKLDIPDYIGVKAIVEVMAEPRYSTYRTELEFKLLERLYRFLNPITGGFDGTGWEMGRAVSPSDIIAVLQDLPEVRYVGAAKLFSIRKHAYQGWLINQIPELLIHPGEWGLISSWAKPDGNNDELPESGHEVYFIE